MIYSVRKDLKKMNINNVIISDGCTKYIEAPNVCCNKPFKARMTEFYYQQLIIKGVHQFNEYENMKPPSRKKIIEYVLDAWSDDEFIHCLKEGQPCKARRQKLNSQPLISVGISDATNLFIFL